MADSSSSPFNPFIILCLLVVVGSGGLAMWKEFTPDSSQADSSQSDAPQSDSTQIEGAVATLPEVQSSTTSSLATPPGETVPPADAVQSTPTAEPATVPNPDQPPIATPQPDPFPNAIAKAEQAQNLSQLAQSQDDWQLVLNRWQQAIALMETVPPSSPNYGQVAARLADYRRNQALAQSKTTQALPDNTQTGQVVVGNNNTDENNTDENNTDNGEQASAGVADPDAAVNPDEGGEQNAVDPDNNRNIDPASEDEAANTARQVYRAPIVRRSGGTPVIQVLFNNEYTVEMIVDTGASGTVITQRVAQSLGVQPTGRTNVSTASAQNVSFLLGEVDSIGVNGVQLDNVVVAIAGPELETGLLGNDFFGQYDVTVRSDVVEFQER
ncbi:MAG: hypothetical protein F6K30_08135 [Cyanothece sp. SIO2G6]|nr:hypothetical protein [Cyanothece sp. SIO2G6]